MEKIIIQVLILLIFWLIVNIILKIILNRCNDDNKNYEIQFALKELATSVLNYRKTIMFDLIILIALLFFNINFLYYFAIVYYIIMALLQGFLIIVSLTTELNRAENKIIINELWLVFLAKIFDEIATFIMIFTLFYLT